MKRTVISLDEGDKEWLDQRARQEGVPMTELVRRAVRLLRARLERGELTFEQLLEQTRDTWPAEDGLDYQRRLRDEW